MSFVGQDTRPTRVFFTNFSALHRTASFFHLRLSNRFRRPSAETIQPVLIVHQRDALILIEIAHSAKRGVAFASSVCVQEIIEIANVNVAVKIEIAADTYVRVYV